MGTSELVQNKYLIMLKKSLFKLWRFHHKLIISLLVLFALSLLILRAAALYLESNRDLIEDFIEQQTHYPVSFDKVKITINPFYPAISLKNFIIKYNDNQSSLTFNEAAIRIDVLQSIIQSELIIDKLSLDGFNAVIERNKNGDIYLMDLLLHSKAQTASNLENSNISYFKILNQTDFEVTHSEIFFVDDMDEYPDMFLTDVNVRMANKQNRHQISIQSSLNTTDAKVDLRLDFKGLVHEINQWDGNVYLNIEGINHPTLLHFLSEEIIQLENYQLNDIDMGLRTWAEIKRGKLNSVRGEIYVDDAQVKRLDTREQVYFNRISSDFKLERHHMKFTDWVLNLYNLNFNIDGKIITDKRIQLHYKHSEQSPGLLVYINDLQLDEFSHVVNFFLPEDINKKIYQRLKPRGELKDITVLMDLESLNMPINISNYHVTMGIENFGLNAFHTLPKIRNLSARIILNKDRGRAYINSKQMSVHLNSLFRDSWPVDSLTGELYWQQEGEQWLLGAKNLALINTHLKINNADVKLWFQPEGSILMDLSGFYKDANVKYVSYYLPAYIMNQGLVKWLDEAIISGWGTDGGVVFRGELKQFPFKDHSGIMDIVFNTRDVELEYTPGWPKLEDIRSQIQFTERGMWIDSDYSRIFSSVSNNVHAAISDYDSSILKLHGKIKSNIKDGVKFLKQSQLASENVTAILDAQGKIDINLDLTIPTEKGTPNSNVSILLHNLDYYPPGFEHKKGLVSELSGKVGVHNESIEANNLSAKIMGRSAKVVIKSSKNKQKKDHSPDVNIAIDSHFSINQLQKYNIIPENMRAFIRYLSGTGRVYINLSLPNEHRPFSTRVTTNLKGFKSSLPFPFNKPAEKSQGLKVSYTDSKYPDIHFSLTDILSLALIIKPSDETLELLKGSVNLGRGKAYLPKKNVLKLSGKMPELPLQKWRAFFMDVTHSKSGQLQKKSQTKILPPVELALSELVVPGFESGNEDKNKTVKQSIDYISPQEFPLINGSIAAVKLSSSHLGRFVIKTSRLEKSIVFDELSLTGEILNFNAKGKWQYRNKIPEMELEGALKVTSFEDFMHLAGYDQLMRGAKAKLSGYLRWPGGPKDLSKETMHGKLAIEVEQGAYLEGKPGTAGRLLGLLNMNALARRISLDFSDVSDKGFEFDEIKGDFRIRKGNAYTDNLTVVAPSAKILVTGRVGLVAEDYDEKVVVVPELSATLPIAGAAVAGPAGAAVAWVGQKLLGSQLNKVTAMSYTVQGTWDKPVIEKAHLKTTALDDLKELFNTNQDTGSVTDKKSAGDK